MKFENSFEVPLPPDRAWAVLMDVERVAPCMPGAELTEIVDDRTFRGRVAVRLGPVALTFAGEAAFEAIDPAARTARVRARGQDPKGRGGASATITFRLAESARGSAVRVETELTLSGAVAQYGRGAGMIRSVAGQLIDQFARSLEAQIVAESIPSPGHRPEDSPAPAAPPISGLPLLWRAVRDWLGSLFGGPAA